MVKDLKKRKHFLLYIRLLVRDIRALIAGLFTLLHHMKVWKEI